jgi:hypothetical protein
MSLSKIASLSALALAFTALTSTAHAATTSAPISTPAQAVASNDSPAGSQAAIDASYVSDHHRPAPHHRPKPPPHPKPAPGG